MRQHKARVVFCPVVFSHPSTHVMNETNGLVSICVATVMLVLEGSVVGSISVYRGENRAKMCVKIMSASHYIHQFINVNRRISSDVVCTSTNSSKVLII